MIYDKIKSGIFLERPNRFIAKVEINGLIETVHVKNTGRCKELLIPGVKVILEDCSHNKTRKTKYSLIAVYKGETLINMDSQIPNKVVYDALLDDKIYGLTNLNLVKREKTYLNSRFDIYYERDNLKGFVEVKGVTLEDNAVAMFPDAPTERGNKHILELIKARENGYEANVLFLIQMSNVKLFKPNKITDPEFSKTLKLAYDSGVKILVYDSIVTEDSIVINKQIPFEL